MATYCENLEHTDGVVVLAGCRTVVTGMCDAAALDRGSCWSDPNSTIVSLGTVQWGPSSRRRSRETQSPTAFGISSVSRCILFNMHAFQVLRLRLLGATPQVQRPSCLILTMNAV